MFVSNIPNGAEKRDIEALFSTVGPLTSCVLTAGQGGDTTAIVTFQDRTHAQASIALDGALIGGSNLSVVAIPEATVNFAQRESQPLYVENQKMVLRMDGGYSSNNVADMAMEAEKRRLDEISRTIYIGNLSPLITEEYVCSLFSVCGNILYVKMAGETGQAVRYAFVEFAHKDAVQAAYSLTGTVLIDRPIKVGPSNNPIVKAIPLSAVNHMPGKHNESMRKLRAAADALERRKRIELGLDQPKSRSRSRDRHRSKDRRSRSRDRDRRR